MLWQAEGWPQTGFDPEIELSNPPLKARYQFTLAEVAPEEENS